jgi:hypothetical protein
MASFVVPDAADEPMGGENFCFDEFMLGVPCMASELEQQLHELGAQEQTAE